MSTSTERSLERVRRLFLALALVACVVAVAGITGLPDRTAGLRLAGLGAVAALAAIWVRSYRCDALSPFDDLIELGALFTVGLAAGPDLALGLVYTGLCRRSLYGSRLRAAAGLAVYALAHVLAVVANGGSLTAVDALAQVPPLAIACAVMHAWAGVLARHEQSVAREHALRDSSAALIGAADRGSLHEATLAAVGRLAPGAPAVVLGRREDGDLIVRAATGEWLPEIACATVAAHDFSADLASDLADGIARAIESPREAGLELFAPPEVAAAPGVCVPLAVRGRVLGLVALFGTGAVSPAVVDALGTIAAESALALAALDSADRVADDRSIERFVGRRRPGMI